MMKQEPCPYCGEQLYRDRWTTTTGSRGYSLTCPNCDEIVKIVQVTGAKPTRFSHQSKPAQPIIPPRKLRL
jgi:predicted RNA-binding Zn-ribbon protein involved in translation (DUF1610 family)